MPTSFTLFPLGWAPTLIAFVAMLVLSQLWFSSLMFQRGWVRHSGIRPTDMRPADKRRLFLISLLARAVAAILLGNIAAHTLGHPSALYACAGAIWIVLAFEQLTGILARREPLALFFLITLRSLSTLMLGALVYHLWSFV